MRRDLFAIVSATLYEPKRDIPQHLLDAAERPMNGADAARLVAQAPPPPMIAKVIDPMEMFRCPPSAN